MSFAKSTRRHRRPRALLEPVEPRLLLTTYYVSPSGNDAASGTSTSTPFRTISRINALDLNAGDKVLFQGGQTFSFTGTNKLPDSGFESGTFNTWKENLDASSGNSTITTTAADVHGGTRALRIGGSTFGGRGQDVTALLSPNAGYTLKLWAKATAGTGATYAGITFYDAAHNELKLVSFTVTGSSYAQYAASFVSPSSFAYVDVWVKKEAGTSVACADDFSLTDANTLVFDANDSGAASSPVTVGSYGTGRATVNAGDALGLVATDVAGFVLQDLNFTGTWDGLAGTGTSTSDGLIFISDLANNAKVNSVRIDDVDVSRFKWQGISFRGRNVKAGFTDVRITNTSSHDNGDAGITFEAMFDPTSTLYAHSGIYLGWCKAYNNGGIANKGGHSGSGIILGDVDGGTIERSLAWNNGQNCNYTTGGPVGIWCWDSNAVTIQYNESYANKTGAASLDGGGFDIDGGCTNCVVQYNYAHDNDGAGYLLYQFTGARAYAGNTVRYNISQNDGRQGHYGGIYLGGGSALKGSAVYGNTIYLTPTSDTSIAAIKLTGIGTGNTFRNNLFYTTSTVRLLDSNAAYSTGSALFQGNAWYAAGGSANFAIRWGATTYTSLAGWRTAAGQEKNGATSTGTSSNPQLVSAGGGGTIGDPSLLGTLTAYQLLAGSPAINAGVNLTSLGVAAGSRDYYGATLSAGGNFDIGTFEWSNALTGTSAGDTYVFRKSATGKLELFANAPTTAPATYRWTAGVYSTYSVGGAGGDDSFTLDLASGNPLATTTMTFDGGTHTAGDSVIVLGTSAADVLALSATAVTPGGSGPSLTYSNVESITLDSGAGDDQVQFNNATAAVTYKPGAGNDALSVNAGTFTFANELAGSGDTSNLAVTVAAGASLAVNATRHLGSLTIAGGATLGAGGKKALVTRSLAFTGTGRLELNDNAVIVDYAAGAASPLGSFDGTSYTGLTGKIARGTWTAGSGIVSAVAAALPNKRAIGIAEASQLLNLAAGQTGAFAGQTVDGSAVLLRYTVSGDADLNGVINGDDYFILDSNSPAAFATATDTSGDTTTADTSGDAAATTDATAAAAAAITSPQFFRGDFNYDGRINGDDYFLLDSNVGQFVVT
jgi:hypothetical protein